MCNLFQNLFMQSSHPCTSQIRGHISFHFFFFFRRMDQTEIWPGGSKTFSSCLVMNNKLLKQLVQSILKAQHIIVQNLLFVLHRRKT